MESLNFYLSFRNLLVDTWIFLQCNFLEFLLSLNKFTMNFYSAEIRTFRYQWVLLVLNILGTKFIICYVEPASTFNLLVTKFFVMDLIN